MSRAVLLLHELPDGSSHLDWLIQRSVSAGGNPSGAPLLSFRVQDRIDSGATLRFGAVRLPDHRAIYLTFEGDVTGGRGKVRRVADGELESTEDTGASIVLIGRLGVARGTFRGAGTRGGSWTFTFAPA